MACERWMVEGRRFDLDPEGYGRAVYTVFTGARHYSLIAFSHHLDPARRTDRVIADAWDATFALFDGVPSGDDLNRLAAEVPKQEAGRFRPSELVLSRANRSVRLFDHVSARLAEGRQPDPRMIRDVGYLMRTTAVYGNGKFGIADRAKIAGRAELHAPFQAEMLTVWLIRLFTLDLVEHVARYQAPERAVPLDPALRRALGIGNATGLGMAPFLAAHPVLIHRWMSTRETALARVRSIGRPSPESLRHFRRVLARARRHVAEWCVPDPRQSARIAALDEDLVRLERWFSDREQGLWDKIYRFAERELSIEGQEMTVSLLLEPHGALVDPLEEELATDDRARLEPAMPGARLAGLIRQHYAWALQIDFARPAARQRFWYVSEDKLEPRLGERFDEPGMDREMPLDIAFAVQKLLTALDERSGEEPVASLLMHRPDLRHVVRRVQTIARHPYGEVRDNLIDGGCLPIDLLRAKLAFFGASKFDPKSDRWTRITLFQGAPLPEDLQRSDADDWCFAVMPSSATDGSCR
ncbi:MAG: hypothetical protein R3349_09800, partial [Geminicoccaceae bacterium]|nr:hypothetical protein [Geminicoccaceae bacterium]